MGVKGMVTAQQVIKIALKYLGAKQYGSVHKALIDRYNSVSPRPSGYKMTYDDAWCDAFVTAVADEAGISDLIGRECGVERHIKLFKDKGIWLGRVRPAVGDLVTMDWDGGGFADHIGFVAEVSGDKFRTIEGNWNNSVGQSYFGWSDWRIKGFARPKYGKSNVTVVKKTVDELAREVIAGSWGNSPNRVSQLKAAGYDATAVQKKVNEMLASNIEAIGADVKRVKVLKKATKYQTGQSIASWVKGETFDVLERKVVSGSGEIYLLGYKGDIIGWVSRADIVKV